MNVQLRNSGEAAIRALGCCRNGAAGGPLPDLVLLDLQLPGISGLDVLRLIRSTPALRALPVVILSCSKRELEIKRCMAASANAFVSKATGYEQFSESVVRIADFWTHARRVA